MYLIHRCFTLTLTWAIAILCALQKYQFRNYAFANYQEPSSRGKLDIRRVRFGDLDTPFDLEAKAAQVHTWAAFCLRLLCSIESPSLLVSQQSIPPRSARDGLELRSTKLLATVSRLCRDRFSHFSFSFRSEHAKLQTIRPTSLPTRHQPKLVNPPAGGLIAPPPEGSFCLCRKVAK